MQFRFRVRLAILAAILSGPSCLAAPPAADELSADEFAAKYAADDFFAACCLRPGKLVDHPVLGSLSLRLDAAPPLSLQRLNAARVTEFVVFCGPVNAGETAPASDRRAGLALQWAAAARFSQPADLADLVRRWRQSTVPDRWGAAAEPETVRIGGRQCFRLPAGTFRNAPRTYGRLRFTDRRGRANQGISVGRIYENRRYVEGNPLATAVFLLEELTEADLIDNRLPLQMRLDVFRTHRLGGEFSRGDITLRNPANRCQSKPVVFAASSYANHELDLPRKLIVVDANGKQRQGDLLQDLVSNGKLEVVLTGLEQAIYLGVGERDLNLRVAAHDIRVPSRGGNWEGVAAGRARLLPSRGGFGQIMLILDRKTHDT